jgi:hypothetical protein
MINSLDHLENMLLLSMATLMLTMLVVCQLQSGFVPSTLILEAVWLHVFVDGVDTVQTQLAMVCYQHLEEQELFCQGSTPPSQPTLL